MSNLSDQKRLLTKQYKDSGNLEARFQLHKLFSTNKQGWHRWVFDQLRIPPNGRVLELGCGPAFLWSKNDDRVPDGWTITLTDFSSGMLEKARTSLAAGGRMYSFEVVDAQSIPFEDESFDAVIANHILYHVKDRDKAYSEIHPVLRPSGYLHAATNGRDHQRELMDLGLATK